MLSFLFMYLFYTFSQDLQYLCDLMEVEKCMSSLDFLRTVRGRPECPDDETWETVGLVALLFYVTLGHQERNKGQDLIGLRLKGHLYGS